MSTAPKQRHGPAPGWGATALDAAERGRPHRHHPRHLLGDTLRAVRVFAESAFHVVVLGDYDASRPGTGPHHA